MAPGQTEPGDVVIDIVLLRMRGHTQRSHQTTREGVGWVVHPPEMHQLASEGRRHEVRLRLAGADLALVYCPSVKDLSMGVTVRQLFADDGVGLYGSCSWVLHHATQRHADPLRSLRSAGAAPQAPPPRGRGDPGPARAHDQGLREGFVLTSPPWTCGRASSSRR